MKRSALLALSALGLLACSTTPKHAPSQAPPPPRSAPAEEAEETVEEGAPVLVALPIVRAGVYRLELSARCAKAERSVTGLLTVEQIAAGSGEDPAEVKASERGRLLWGHTDVDLRALSGCLGSSARSGEEPIHPSVLVEVLKWEGEPRHQVLLVSFDAQRPRGGRARPVGGVALRVETAEQGHMTGVWSRWELIGQDDGRWEAQLEPATAERGVSPAKAVRTGSRSTSKD